MLIHWPGAPAQDKKEMKHISKRCCSESPKNRSLPCTLGTASQFSVHWKHPTWFSAHCSLLVFTHLLFTLETPNQFSVHCSLHWKHPTSSQHTVLYPWNTQPVLSTLLSTRETPNWFSVHCSLITGSAQFVSQHITLSTRKTSNLTLEVYKRGNKEA